MICPKCGSENVNIELVQTGGRTARHGTGLGGNFNNMMRGTTALMTFGTSNLVWKKSQGTQKEKIKTQKMCLCQGCGNTWKIK
ncbi:hypothetical protein CKALI_03760 [Corynebacterium kalinowskii]|uniref:Uncharacterized protein n=2 Tax=Corynebacterium kalinowskii TaxID=2675216 RepID=A0A6B8VBU2_9CORY|nr:hypothetical protein CKALI_03760 [Corynebacterium kalinowskii]